MKLLTTVLAILLIINVVAGQATRPRSTRIITGTSWPYGTPQVGDEWVDTSVSPAETRNCLTDGVWSTVAVLSPDGSSSNTINGASQTVQIAMSQYRGVGVVITGTWVGTLVPELSMDGGSSWTTGQFYVEAQGLLPSTAANITASIVVHGGVSHVRVRSSAWTSGTATIALRATEASTPIVSSLSKVAPSNLTTLLNAVTANGAGPSMDVSGYTSVSFVVTGTFDATLTFEGSVDGTNWVTLTAVAWDNGGFWNNSFSQAGSYTTMVGSLSQVRAKVAEYAEGTITVKALASLAVSTISFKGIEMIPTAPVRIIGAAGATLDSSVGPGGAPPNQIVTGGVYNSTKPTLADGDAAAVQVDAKGSQLSVVRDAAGNDRGANVNASNQLSVSVDNTPNVGVTDNPTRDLGKIDVASLDQYTPVSGRLPVDGSGVTQPVSAASLPLPTGAATSTKQSDGSQKTQLVDGAGNVVSSTSNALDINIKSGNPTTITVTQATASNLNTDANLKTVGGSAVSTGNGVSGSGVQRVTIANDSTGQVTLASGTTTAVTQATSSSLNADANLKTIAGNAVSAGNGTSGTGVQRVTIASDSTGQVALASGSNTIGSLAANQSVNVAQMNGATVNTGNGTASGSQRVTIASDSTGTVAATQSGTWTVQPGNTANTTAWITQPVPGTANGASTCVVQSAASTNATNCKASAGLIYGIEVVNTTSTIYYLRLYNLSSSPTCSSATGFIRTIPIPHGAGAGAGIANFYTVGETYGTGIGFCLTAGGASTDNTNAATGVFITLFYK